ncbi:MAG: hypothetical protein ACYDEJ_12085 [Desulfitobacteriaceae bacterium]
MVCLVGSPLVYNNSVVIQFYLEGGQTMSTFVQRALKAAREYTVMDYACLKITLLSFGILLGAYFAKFFLSYTSFLWVVFIVSFLWIMYRTFIKYIN